MKPTLHGSMVSLQCGSYTTIVPLHLSAVPLHHEVGQVVDTIREVTTRSVHGFLCSVGVYTLTYVGT